MIRQSPVWKNRDIQTWLDPESGFMTGTVRLVEDLIQSENPPAFKTLYLNGLLLRKRESGDGEEDEKGVAKILASLAHHADHALSLTVSRVPMMVMSRTDHPSSGLPILQTIEMADVLVLSGFSSLYERDVKMVDSIIADRARPPARVTALVIPQEDPPNLATTLALFGKRRIDLWKE